MNRNSRILNELFPCKCTCMWSKNNKSGFVPFADCEVHGEDVKKSLKRMKPYHYVGNDAKCDLGEQEKKDE